MARSKTLTDEQRGEIREDLYRMMIDFGLSQRKVASAINVKPSTFSQILDGSYKADADPHLLKLREYIETECRRRVAPQPPAFAMTKLAEEIVGTLTVMRDQRKFGLIFAPSGPGKTAAVRWWCEHRNALSVYVTLFPGDANQYGVMRAIGKAMVESGLLKAEEWKAAKTYTKQRPLIERVLTEKQPPLVIDEGDWITEKAAHVLRSLWDGRGITLILVGTPKLNDLLEKWRRSGDEHDAQILSRISMKRDIQAAMPKDRNGRPLLFTVADIDKIFCNRQVRVTLDPDAKRWMTYLANNLMAGSLRACMNVYLMACTVFPEVDLLTAKMLESASYVSVNGAEAQLWRDTLGEESHRLAATA